MTPASTVRSISDRAIPESHGWRLAAHPLFLDQLDRLTAAASREAPNGPNRKLLAHVLDLLLERIPRDPGAPSHRHGGALDGAGREWFRGKTGAGRYRLFYRFSSREKLIVYGWLNDAESLRTRGASTDAYAVFARMLRQGNPPSTWHALVEAAMEEENGRRTRSLFEGR
jgi:toxin YhaV